MVSIWVMIWCCRFIIICFFLLVWCKVVWFVYVIGFWVVIWCCWLVIIFIFLVKIVIFYLFIIFVCFKMIISIRIIIWWCRLKIIVMYYCRVFEEWVRSWWDWGKVVFNCCSFGIWFFVVIYKNMFSFRVVILFLINI